MAKHASVPNKIAYQGEDGANSHVACAEVYPELEPIPCQTFEDAIGEVDFLSNTDQEESHQNVEESPLFGPPF